MESLICLNKASIALLDKHGLLRGLISAEISEDLFKDISVSDEKKEIIFKEFCKNKNLLTKESLDNFLRENFLTIDKLNNALLTSFKKSIYSYKNFRSKAENRFLERKEQLDSVIYSLIRVKDKFKAREIWIQINEKESEFSDMASRFSEGSEKMRQGIVGPVPLLQSNPKVCQTLRSLAPGELAQPIAVGGFYLIIRLEKYLPATLDGQTRQTMSNELFDKWLKDETERMLNEILTSTETPIK
tara:strand:- start:1256 stop:1987 length:732 start_codon:yes stop_codon:yes gene_type:complete